MTVGLVLAAVAGGVAAGRGGVSACRAAALTGAKPSAQTSRMNSMRSIGGGRTDLAAQLPSESSSGAQQLFHLPVSTYTVGTGWRSGARWLWHHGRLLGAQHHRGPPMQKHGRPSSS
jgi:hypothetical protein